MDFSFSGTPIDPLWLVVAFGLGLAGRFVGLPPLVGFLLAGFVLNAFGFEGGEIVESLADLGVTLLLFSIGLKLRIQTLLKPAVWATASLHMGITVLLFGAAALGLGALGVSKFDQLSVGTALLVAFALSFSSTVFAVKVFEEKGDMASLYGRMAIGILIMQDVVAVAFLSASSGKFPTVWALGLFALPLLRPLIMALMDRAGHGELLLLFGLFIALVVGAEGFHMVGMKADLGALVLGVLVSGHKRANELANSLLSVKDLFLVAFFLNIGLSSSLGLAEFGVAVLLVLAVPFKVALFYGLFTLFRLRARTSLLSSLSLANYSEFGLIVAAIGVSQGWLGPDWLAILAIALAITFILAAPLNESAHSLYDRYVALLHRFERSKRLPDDQPLDTGEATILIFGMGRIGTGAYDTMKARFGDVVVGVDSDDRTVQEQVEAGRHVFLGDASDADFWQTVKRTGRVKLVMLSMPHHRQNLFAVSELRTATFPGMIAATARFDDEVAELESLGVTTMNFYAEAGSGFAEHVIEALEPETV